MTYNSIKTIESADPTDPDVAVDRVGGLDYQRIKLQWGPEGTVNDTDDASGKRFPVNLAQSALIGAVDETAPGTDTASSGLNGRLQRIAQRLTSLIALVPTALTSAGNFKVALLERTQTSMTYTHTQPSATSTSGAMLNSNASRKYALLTNIGTVDVFLKVDATAVASQGILLQAYGGTYEVSPTNNNFTTAAINGITASGTATVLVTEGT